MKNELPIEIIYPSGMTREQFIEAYNKKQRTKREAIEKEKAHNALKKKS